MNENITSESGQVEKMKTAKENYGKVSTLWIHIKCMLMS